MSLIKVVCPNCGETINVMMENNNERTNNDFEIEGRILKKYHGNDDEVIIPDSVIEIATYSFANVYVKSVKIPNTVRRICTSAFANCKALEEIVLPEGLKKMEGNEFVECEKLEKIVFPCSLEEIGRESFERCTSLKEVKIPSNVRIIGESAFRWCINLKEVELSEGLTEINGYAFAGTAIEEIIIPESVEKIEYKHYDVFEGCKNLKRISCNNPNSKALREWVEHSSTALAKSMKISS